MLQGQWEFEDCCMKVDYPERIDLTALELKIISTISIAAIMRFDSAEASELTIGVYRGWQIFMIISRIPLGILLNQQKAGNADG